MSRRWEYHVIAGDPVHKKVGPQFMEDLQALGRQGWEAVGYSSIGDLGRVQVLLKREVVDERPGA